MIEKFLVTGHKGFLGAGVFNDLRKEGHIVRGIDLDTVDIIDEEKVKEFILKFQPTVVFHAAAMASASNCEKEPEKAYKTNVEGTRNIVAASNLVRAKVIFTSSMHVFDGKRGNYSEADSPNPINVYGKTKLEAESIVLSSSNQNLVLRLGTLYGYTGDNKGAIIEELNLLRQNKPCIGLEDVYRSFTLINDFKDAILIFIKEKSMGIYNFCGYENMSDYNFSVLVAKVFDFDESLILAQNGESFIPKNATLNPSGIKKLGIKMHSVEEGLEIVKREMGL